MLYVQILKDNDSHHAFSQLTRFVDDVDDDENSSVIRKLRFQMFQKNSVHLIKKLMYISYSWINNNNIDKSKNFINFI